MSTANTVLLVVSALLALGGAVGTIAAARPLRAALALLVNIVALAGVFLSLHAQFLAMVQLIVYAGAVVVLFVFVIMMVGATGKVPRSPRGLATKTVSLVVMSVVSLVLVFGVAYVSMPAAHLPHGYGTVEGLGAVLFTQAAVPFELVSITLLVAVVGALAVARGRTPKEAAEARARRAAEGLEADARLAEERRISAEVSAHGGH
ncbi:MAG: NADH-quinone oxidoreductase subunit J [Deltaproteobacteria bacterium]|nr:NADH-quinone oxidoreductase subunit J [Deltaproteobacteria bacterium]